jgi:hypothetical protein
MRRALFSNRVALLALLLLPLLAVALLWLCWCLQHADTYRNGVSSENGLAIPDLHRGAGQNGPPSNPLHLTGRAITDSQEVQVTVARPTGS